MDDAGPTPERLRQAGEYFAVSRSRSHRKITMLDDALGRALVRQILQVDEYTSLRRYALHWTAGGLQGHLNSIDLNRVLAFDPAAMSGLARTERQADHRQLYRLAHDYLGLRPAFVADSVACHDIQLTTVGEMLGYKSRTRGREKAVELLRDAGARLIKFWDELNKRH